MSRTHAFPRTIPGARYVELPGGDHVPWFDPDPVLAEIRCAQSIIDAVRLFDLDVRAGLHTGEVELADGKIAGIAVNIGARVAARCSSRARCETSSPDPASSSTTEGRRR
jgi:class 3 adenylate cyclase